MSATIATLSLSQTVQCVKVSYSARRPEKRSGKMLVGQITNCNESLWPARSLAVHKVAAGDELNIRRGGTEGLVRATTSSRSTAFRVAVKMKVSFSNGSRQREVQRLLLLLAARWTLPGGKLTC